MIVFPNAKINLGLHILFKREDGFHEIESVFVPVDLCDVLEFVACGEATSFQSSGIAIPGNPEANLCVKAWEIINKEYGISNVKIHLQKNIPIGAGLGGGSADGAFMLLALNDYFNLGIGKDRLKGFAAQLGSDCPFFIDNEPCFVTGRGEKLQTIALDLSAYQLLLVYPDIHIGTGEAYANISPQIPKVSLKNRITHSKETWQEYIKNDFEASVFPNHKELPELKNAIKALGAHYVSMTGSGSAIFGLFPKEMDVKTGTLAEQYKTYLVNPILT